MRENNYWPARPAPVIGPGPDSKNPAEVLMTSGQTGKVMALAFSLLILAVIIIGGLVIIVRETI